ncbi:ssDNA endonuclease and repair protein rad10 [Vermiconidia calcicola]|uniref:SsDNA endonuclease and repair protein rad10 n=1 Tax=Vermiconidia calcicola TaxID=1690605 RepID=A0ACC3NYV4_9PEZI|nr:ssDNA endonuclease and repair protein rad10 [Vermiconidia calcicola]
MKGDEIEDSHAPAARAGPSASTNGQPSKEPPAPLNQSKTTRNPDRPSNNNTAPKSGVIQPKPQPSSKRSAPSSIIVSPRQKGNPILSAIKSIPWEYGDIPADYVLGLTTCALFLSLKYHRLHPEYIYSRIKALQGKYALRIVLCMVDISNHEDSLRELSKTSLINNVTLILCWSSAEGGRYLELFKTYENAAPTSIKQHQSTKYGDRMIDFVTTPRSINKTDAVSLVSQFGTLRTAVNARHEDVAMVAGWGERKCQQWCGSVREPFRVKRAARRGIGREGTGASSMMSREATRDEGSESPMPLASGEGPSLRRQQSTGTSRPGTADADRRPSTRLAEEVSVRDDEGHEEALAEAMTAAPVPPKRAPSTEVPKKRKHADDPLEDGVMAALSKLRKDGG